MQGTGLLCAAPFIVLMGNSNILLTIYIGYAGFGFARAFLTLILMLFYMT